MSETIKKRRWVKWVVGGCLALIALLVLLIAAGRFYITTSSGADFIEKQLNSRSFGPIEGLEVSGLSGDPLSELKIESLKVRDKEGVWATAENISLQWQPLKFLSKHLYIEDLNIADIDIQRKPVLNETAPSEPSDNPLTVTLDNFETPSLSLGEPVIGQSVSARLKAQYALRENGSMKALMDAVRTDVEGDSINLDFTRTPQGEMQGDFDLEGLPGGTIATLLQAPENQTVTGTGTINGDVEAGQGDISLAFDNLDVLDLETNWTPENLSASAQAETQNWPLLAPARNIDSRIRGQFSLGRSSSEKPFDLNVQAGGASVIATGELPEEGFMPESANLQVDIPDVARFYKLPEGYRLGGIEIDGQIKSADEASFTGTAAVSSVSTPQGRAKAVSGPLTLTLNESRNVADFQTEISATGVVISAEIPLDLKPTVKLIAKGQYNLESQTLQLASSKLLSGQDTATASGRLSTDPLTYSLSGRANLALKAVGTLPSGQLTADYKAVQNKNALPALTADGRFIPSGELEEPIASLVGSMALFDVNASPIEGGIDVSRGIVSGDGFQAAFSGRVTEDINMDLEASLKQAVTFKSVTLAEGTDVSGSVTGRRDSPNIRLDASAPELTAYNRLFSDVRLRTEIQDIVEAPKGPIQLDAGSEYGDVTVSAQFSSSDSVLRLADLQASVGQLTATGNLALPESGIAEGQMALDLPEEDGRYARLDLELENLQGEQGINLTADAKNVAYKQVEIDSLKATLQGTLSELKGNIDTNGQTVGRVVDTPFQLNTPVTVTQNEAEGYTVTLLPDAAYGRVPIVAREPLLVKYNQGETSLSAALDVADGNVDLNYQRGEQERLVAEVRNLPISSLPVGNFLADTKGRLAMDIDLSVPNNQPEGDLNVALTDWRGFDRQKGQGLSINFDGQLTASELDWTLTGLTEEDFNLNGNGVVALKSENSLTSIRPNMSAPLKARLSASGAAEGVLGLVAPEDAGLSGQLEANLDVDGTLAAPLITGEASGNSIEMEMIELGTQIRDGLFVFRFSNDNVSLEEFSINDGNDGRLTGSGNFKLGEFGVPIGQANFKAQSFRALDRRDLSGRVSGDITMKTEKEQGTLSGNVTIERAEVKQFVSGGPGVVTIDVEEVNLPPQRKKPEAKPEPYPIELDLNVSAPRRIFIRSQGLDVEMSIEAEIKGTAMEPEIYGEARVIRGGYKIAGKELDFESGVINFDGPVSAAKIDFVANTETQNLEAGVKITGTVEKPEIELSSTPTRPDDEILSALLFGRSATELSAVEAAQLAGALAQFSGNGGGFDLLGGLRDALGVGQLSVGFNEDGTAQITGGRYLAKDVYLQVFSGVGENASGAIIDWEVRRNLSLRSRIQADNEQALSLKWKRDF
jgi:autotransporter translocation and assembly factor TamB